MFVSGVVCMATKRNALGVLMGIELVLNGANVNFVAFGSKFLQRRTQLARARRSVDRPVRDRAGRRRSGRGPGDHAEFLQQPRHRRRRSRRRVEGLAETRTGASPSMHLDPQQTLPKLLASPGCCRWRRSRSILFFGPRMGKKAWRRLCRHGRDRRVCCCRSSLASCFVRPARTASPSPAVITATTCRRHPA